MDIVLGVLLITAILGVTHWAMRLLFDPRTEATLRRSRHSRIAREAMRDIDRKYEELLRS